MKRQKNRFVLLLALAWLTSVSCYAPPARSDTDLEAAPVSAEFEEQAPDSAMLPWAKVEEAVPAAEEYFSEVHPFDYAAILEAQSRYVPEPYAVFTRVDLALGGYDAAELALVDTGEGVTVRPLSDTPVRELCGLDRDWVYAVTEDSTQIIRVDYLGQIEEVVFTDLTGCLSNVLLYQHTLYFIAGTEKGTLGIYRLYLPDGSQTILYDQIPADSVGLQLTPVSSEEMEWCVENPEFTALAEAHLQERMDSMEMDEPTARGSLELDFQIPGQAVYYYNARTGQLKEARRNVIYNTYDLYTPDGEHFFNTVTDGGNWWESAP